MARLTPPIGISGSFDLRSPYVADPASLYTVIAIRRFSEIIARGQDPVALVYTPVQLGPEAYQSDVEEGALVVCLKDEQGNLLYVPDTYIARYPQLGGIPYSHLIVSASLGAWPEYRDTQDIQQAVTEAIESRLGTTPEIFLSRAPTVEMVSEEQHTVLQAARLAAITNAETSTATILRLSDQVARLQRTIDEQALIIESLTQ